MKPKPPILLLALLLSACGIPQASLQLARQQAALATANLTDDQITAALRDQADQWNAIAALVSQNQLGGILLVDPSFKSLVQQTAAAATRLRTLIDSNQDDPTLRRDLLAAFQALWTQAQNYLQ